jgi:radical SAM superfamily enzyme YgiQ (UPF0313 family)
VNSVALKLPILPADQPEPPPSFAPFPVKKVLLIYPFAVSEKYSLAETLNGGAYIEAPLGIGYVASYLERAMPDLEVEIFDANAVAIRRILETERVDMDELWSIVEAQVAAAEADVIGVSCLFINVAAVAHRTAAVARKAAPRAVIVMGGQYPSNMAEGTLTDGNVDFVVLSEGEKTFTELLHALRSGIDPSSIVHGVAYKPAIIQRLRSGDIEPEAPTSSTAIRIPKGDLPKVLEEFPWPNRRGWDMELYATYTRHWAFRLLDPKTTRIATMTASRGCPFRCTFCQSTEFWGREIRYRNPKDVVDEMRHLVETYGINTFVFNDDNIMFRRSSVLALCNEMKRQNLDIRWMSGGGIQVSTMKPDVIQAVIETGLRLFNLAIESGNERTLRRIEKPLTKGVSEEVIANIRKYDGIWVCSNFITGFWFETMADIRENLEYAGSLDLDWRSIYSFTPLPGTADFEECVKHGYLRPWSGWETHQLDDFVQLSTEHFDAEELRVMNYTAGLEYNFLKNRNLVHNPTHAVREFEYVIENVPDHAFAHYCKGLAERALGRIDDSIASFEGAKRIADRGRDEVGNIALRAHCLYKGKKNGEDSPEAPLADEEGFQGRWIDYFDRFGVDIEATLNETRRMRPGQ